MATPMENAIIALKNFGAFQFLFPFMLTAAIFYGLLRKSKIFGEPEKNMVVNATVALVAAFMVWAYPILAGVNIETQLSMFFFYGTISILTISIGLMILGMFLSKGVGEYLEVKMGKTFWGGILGIGLLIGFGILISSGLISTIFGPVPGASWEDIQGLIAVIIIIIVLMAIAFWPSKSTPQQTTQ